MGICQKIRAADGPINEMQVKGLVTVLKYLTRFHLMFTDVWVPLDGDIPADSRWASTCVSTQCLPSSVSSVTI